MSKNTLSRGQAALAVIAVLAILVITIFVLALARIADWAERMWYKILGKPYPYASLFADADLDYY